MADLTFAQSSRRNLTVPVLVAVALLGIAAGLVYRYMAGQTVSTSITRTEVFPIRVVYKQVQPKGFKVLEKQPKSLDEGIYILATIHIDNHLRDPLFLKDFHATVDTAAGQYKASGIEQADLAVVIAAFPDLKQKLATPLLREATIAPGQSSEGTVILQFPTTQSVWDARLSAALTLDLYHQPSVVLAFPKP